MKALPLQYLRRSFVGVSLFLIFVLAACGAGNGQGNGPSTAQDPASEIKIGPQPCPAPVKNPSYWDAILGTQNGDRVERVSCGNLIGNASLQVLVTVRAPGPDRFLDVYVFNSITSRSPEPLFKLQGLRMGDAKISGYNTVITAQVDANSSINKGQPPPKQTQDLFREFKGVEGAGTFIQVAFPGLFPDLTRFQAEADQARVNQGKDAWKLDAQRTAYQLATTLLGWKPASTTTTLISGGGTQDITALVLVHTAQPAPSLPMKVSLSRLEGNNAGGIWEVTATHADDMAITAPQNGATVTSPVPVTGYGRPFEGEVGVVYLLDHLYNKSALVIARGEMKAGAFPAFDAFSVQVPYNFSFHGGSQEGAVVLVDHSPGGVGTASVVVKVLLSA